jgi:hypothetical protein
MRIGVHKNQPVAARRRRAGIARAPDLIERLKNDFCARGFGNFGSAVGGIIIADDKFNIPAALRERRRRRFDLRKRLAEKFFLVESGHDDRDFHAATVTRFSAEDMILIVLFLADVF